MPAYTKLFGAHLHNSDTPTANTPNAALKVYRHNRGHSLGEGNVSRLNGRDCRRTAGE
jgi:hypothetical protein